MPRPFKPEDLGLRLRALLRVDVMESIQIRRAGLRIDHLHRVVWKEERKVVLGTNQWGILLALAQSRQPLGGLDLSKAVWARIFRAATRSSNSG
jgi:DNA-binding response OmpR family regulator